MVGLFNAMKGSKIEELGGEQVVEEVKNWGPENLGLLGSEQALSIAITMDIDHFEILEPDKLLGLITAIEAKDVETIGSEVLEVVASNLEVGGLFWE